MPSRLIDLLRLGVCVLLVVASLAASETALSLHGIFSDHMVLQRDLPLPVWGRAQPGATITVELDGSQASATADGEGRWRATLPAHAVGGPFVLSVRAGEEALQCADVLLGDVWICSGQSNMEMGVLSCLDGQAEATAADHPQIRLLRVPKRIELMPQEELESAWELCTPESISKPGWGGFSAAAYYFGRHIQQQIGVPVGLIQTCWGGTPAETWTSSEALASSSTFAPRIEEMAAFIANREAALAAFSAQLDAWWAANDPAISQGLAAPDLDDATWPRLRTPGSWESAEIEDLKTFDGLVVLRRAVEIPEAWAGKPLALNLAKIDDADRCYWDGELVGQSDRWDVLRRYQVPAELATAGRHVITVSALDTGGGGGIYGSADQMSIGPEGESQFLAGDWAYRIGKPLKEMPPVPRRVDLNQNSPATLFNGMIAPLLPYAVKGAIWYQGEANAGRAGQYRELLALMIADWRARFGVGDFPFLIVQLASFAKQQVQPAEGGWAALREAQQQVAATVPNCGLACAIDLGEANDIHPKNKQEVGRRLGLEAERIAYGRELLSSGPVFRALNIENGVARLDFDHLGGGLLVKADDGQLRGFALAGADGVFVWAEARIEGDTVLVSSPQVAEPVAVRYGWASNPVGNLFSQAGLPALPFRSDLGGK
jgi:sialate O-acetylesterase